MIDSQMHGYYKLIEGVWTPVHPSTIKRGDLFKTYDRGHGSPVVRALADASFVPRHTAEPCWGVTPVERVEL